MKVLENIGMKLKALESIKRRRDKRKEWIEKESNSSDLSYWIEQLCSSENAIKFLEKMIYVKRCGDCPYLTEGDMQDPFCTKLSCVIAPDTLLLGVLDSCPLEEVKE